MKNFPHPIVIKITKNYNNQMVHGFKDSFGCFTNVSKKNFFVASFECYVIYLYALIQ